VKREDLRKKGRQDGENGIGTCGDGAHDEEEEGSGLWMLPRGWVGEEATGLDWRPLIRLLLLPLSLSVSLFRENRGKEGEPFFFHFTS
jgi:hypothetical protein